MEKRLECRGTWQDLEGLRCAPGDFRNKSGLAK